MQQESLEMNFSCGHKSETEVTVLNVEVLRVVLDVRSCCFRSNIFLYMQRQYKVSSVSLHMYEYCISSSGVLHCQELMRDEYKLHLPAPHLLSNQNNIRRIHVVEVSFVICRLSCATLMDSPRSSYR